MSEPAKIIVSGASGFVGAHLAVGLQGSGFRVTALGGRRNCPEEVQRAGVKTFNLDLGDRALVESLLQAEKPDVFVHAAALARVNECEKDPVRAERENVSVTEMLLATLGKTTPKAKFLYISTDLVFDGGSAPIGGFTEEQPVVPLSVYAKTKAAAEKLVLASNLDACVLRTCLVYGAPIGSETGFLGWLRGDLAQGKSVRLFLDEFRTPVFVDDILEVVKALSRSSERLPHQLLHVGGSERISRFDFGVKLVKQFGYDPSLLQPMLIETAGPAVGSPSVPRPKDVSLSIKRLEATLGFRPRDIETGLAALFSSLVAR